MNHLFATYKQSHRLKELGFNKPCIAKYVKGSFQNNTLGIWNNYNDGTWGSSLISAPLYSQAIKFMLNLLEIKSREEDSGHPQGGYGVRYFGLGQGGNIFEIGREGSLFNYRDDCDCLSILLKLLDKKTGELVHIKTFFKPPQTEGSFTIGEFYEIKSIDEDVVWIYDNDKKACAFSYDTISDYFNW